MNELEVIVKQEPGVIQWNFEDLKSALSEEMSEYENIVYDDNAIAVAKKDVASLRKLKKSVDDRRKEIKAKCLEPYDVIEKQAKELTGLIDKPIGLIAGQIDEYENAQREARKEKIIKYMTDEFSDLPKEIQKKAQLSTYVSRWENKTVSEDEWKSEIDKAHGQFKREVETVQGVDEDFRDEAMKVYQINLSLPDAMSKVQELQRQKDMLIEKQRQREEAIRAEAARKAEQERLAKEADREWANTRVSVMSKEAVYAEKKEREAQEKAEEEKWKKEMPPIMAVKAPQRAQEAVKDRSANNSEQRVEKLESEGITGRTYMIYGTDAQISKILGYIKFVGASAEEIK